VTVNKLQSLKFICVLNVLVYALLLLIARLFVPGFWAETVAFVCKS